MRHGVSLTFSTDEEIRLFFLNSLEKYSGTLANPHFGISKVIGARPTIFPGRALE
jgi:hypothetical protein